VIRALFLMALLAAVIAAATWLADHPGMVQIEWWGYQIRMAVSVLAALVAGISILAALAYRLWWGLRRAPRLFAARRREGRRHRGSRALRQGILAAAAGDARETQRHADKAAALLADPTLTLLLSAQAAQLRGEEDVAASFFNAMLDKPETAFLGLRGLIGQAMRAGREDEARGLIEKARDLHPKTPWVATALFDLQTRSGKWGEAEESLKRARRHKTMPAQMFGPWLAILLLEQSRAAQAGGQSIPALTLAERAVKRDPDLTPAAVHLADMLLRAGRERRARNVLKKLWRRAPHPALAAAYAAMDEDSDPLARMRRLKKLTALNAGHPESKLALGQAALDAGLWGEARSHLGHAADGPPPSRRVCLMLAELEERGNGNPSRAREWRDGAAQAGPDAAWVCGHCGAATQDWASRCGQCGAFAAMEWRIPGGDRPDLAVAATESLFPVMAVST
jgi:HemY protein